MIDFQIRWWYNLSFVSYMMASSNGNIFRVTGPLCGEFIGDRWILLAKAIDGELWCFLWSASEQTFEHTIEALVILDAIALIVTIVLRRFLITSTHVPNFWGHCNWSALLKVPQKWTMRNYTDDLITHGRKIPCIFNSFRKELMHIHMKQIDFCGIPFIEWFELAVIFTTIFVLL